MKVIVATSIHPFVDGGASYLTDALERALQVRGHEVETLRIPFSDDPQEVLEQAFAFRLMDVSHLGDRLIAIRTPSHLLRHPRKVIWFIHHYRSAYDLWGTKYQTIPNTPEGKAIRQAIITSDNVGLGEASAMFCNSSVVKRRLQTYNGIRAEVLYPPLPTEATYQCAGYGDYILYLNRITHHKRQWLAIESMRYVNSAVKLVIAGAPDPGCEDYVGELNRMVREYHLSDRVVIASRWISEQEKLDLYSKCLAVAYFPFDEDSYGFPSLEAHHASKAVLTTTDAGGTSELIVDNSNGFILPPDPELIGSAMDRLFLDRSQAQAMGERGLLRVGELGITWDHAVGRLLA